jgi:hypothetical protein
MTEKANNDLASELMRRYGIKPEDDKVEFKPPPPPSEAAASDPFYSSPSPADTKEAVVAVNPLLQVQEDEEKKKKEEPKQNVLQRNESLTELGALLGAGAQYKGVGQNLLRPAMDLFAPRDAGIPGQVAGAAPTVPMTDVEHTMQSGQGQRPGETGRQRENTHNQETQRQALAAKQNLQLPGAANVVVNAGPMYTTESGLSIPKSTAVTLEQELQARQAVEAEQRRQLLERQATEQRRIQQQQANRAKVAGAATGVKQLGQGVVGGALAAPQLYEYGRDVIKQDKSKPADTTQGLSGLGGLIMALGKGKAGPLGAALQVPYMYKHADEISRSMKMSDINPTAFMGMPDELSGINAPLPPRRQPKPVDDGYGPLRQLPR